jgi:hypothetical protein
MLWPVKIISLVLEKCDGEYRYDFYMQAYVLAEFMYAIGAVSLRNMAVLCH